MSEYREDHYRVLGVAPDATPAQIREAWLRLISYWHPDRSNHQSAESRAKELNRAYQTLSYEKSRADYDRWYQSSGGMPKHDSPPPPSQPEEQPQAEPVTWQPPPPDYRHHPGIDPLTGVPLPQSNSRARGYMLWAAGFAGWLALLGISIGIGAASSNPAVVTMISVVDVMCLWTWLFAIAALRGRPRREWRRFWGAELLGALTATSVTLLLAAIAIAASVLLLPAGLDALRQGVGIVGALAVLALAGGLGAFTFRFVLQRWEEIKKAPRHAPEAGTLR